VLVVLAAGEAAFDSLLPEEPSDLPDELSDFPEEPSDDVDELDASEEVLLFESSLLPPGLADE
jgi:hypothetical protein